MSENLSRKCFVTYETRFSGRLDATAGLALLIASLGRHMPDIPLFIFHTEPCDNLKTFAEKFGPQCVFQQVDESQYYSWYGKPNAILSMIDSGYDRTCWLDSDLIFTKDCTEMLFPKDHTVLRTTQAPNTPRCVPDRHIALFGTPPSVNLITSVSSGIVSATAYHWDIIVMWSKIMREKLDFLKANKTLFVGDQEVLEAVLMNTSNSNSILKPILNNIEHLTCDKSIGIRKSLNLIFSSSPPIIHSTPYKAWWPLNRPFEHGARSFLDCTPYTVEARRFHHSIKEMQGRVFINWLSPSTIKSKICYSLPPWSFASPLFWYFVISKLFKDSNEPSDVERRLALALESGGDVTTQK